MSVILKPFKKIYYCFRYENPEITAWMKTASSRGPETVVASLFTATALIFLASELDDDCDDRVDIGLATLKTSSILSAASVVENLVNAFLSPYWGALADAKSTRKSLLVISSITWISMVALGAVLLFFEPSLVILWLFFLTILFTVVFYELALLLALAYLPEIVDDEDQLTALASRQYAIVNFLQLAAAAFLVGVSLVLGDTFENDLPLTVIAHAVVVLVWMYFAIPGLIHLPSRAAPKEGEPGFSSRKTGSAFRELWLTLKDVFANYPNVGWFLAAWMFYFAGVASVTILQVSYVTEEFGYSTSEVSYLGAVVLVFSVGGAMLAETFSKKFKLKTLLLGAISVWTVVCFIAPYLLLGEDKEVPTTDNTTGRCGEVLLITREPTALGEIMAFVFAGFVGIGVGFVYPVNTAIYSLIIPGGREASFFGLKTFGSKVVSWAPPLVFTLINEKTDNIQFAFQSLGFWFAISIPFVLMMNVEQGIRDVEDTLQFRQGTGKHLFVGDREQEKEGMEEESVVKITTDNKPSI